MFFLIIFLLYYPPLLLVRSKGIVVNFRKLPLTLRFDLSLTASNKRGGKHCGLANRIALFLTAMIISTTVASQLRRSFLSSLVYFFRPATRRCMTKLNHSKKEHIVLGSVTVVPSYNMALALENFVAF